MRMRTLKLALIAASTLVVAGAWLGSAEDLPFAPSNYYVFSLGPAVADLTALAQTADAEGYTVVRYGEDGSIAASDGSATIDAAAERLLAIDSGRFLLRVVGESFTYAVRSATSGIELVFSPATAMAMESVVSILLELQSLGAIGGEIDFAYRAYARDALKGPEPPVGARIESDLYWLTVAEDWQTFAAASGLTLVGLRVEVIAELLPEATVPERFAPYVTSASDSLARFHLPIDELIPLAWSGVVDLVRAPYEPVAP